MVAFVFPTPGSLKRVVKVEDAIAVSIKQWRELPRKYFLSAWVKTGNTDGRNKSDSRRT